MREIIHSIVVSALRRERVNALFDSGATTTYVRKDLADRIGMGYERKVNTFLADGTPIVGIFSKINIHIRGTMLPTNAVIVNKLDRQIIVGVDFLQSTKSFLDFSSDKLVLKDTLKTELKRIRYRRFRL